MTEVKGYGRQKGHTEIYRGAEYAVSFTAQNQNRSRRTRCYIHAKAALTGVRRALGRPSFAPPCQRWSAGSAFPVVGASISRSQRSRLRRSQRQFGDRGVSKPPLSGLPFECHGANLIALDLYFMPFAHLSRSAVRRSMSLSSGLRRCGIPASLRCNARCLVVVIRSGAMRSRRACVARSTPSSCR